MTASERIAAAAYGSLVGAVELPRSSGLCLQLVRVVVEAGMNWQPFEFYRRHLTHRVERAPGDDDDPWARDLERSFGMQGHVVVRPVDGQRYVTKESIRAAAVPGDILFRWDAAKTRAGTFVGHVGILLDGGLVLENVNPVFRKRAFHQSSNRVTTFTSIVDFAVTLVGRVPG